ncbi:MAG: hypothetical protein ACI9G1_002794, partial [Pirellulaceae bacterium]
VGGREMQISRNVYYAPHELLGNGLLVSSCLK